MEGNDANGSCLGFTVLLLRCGAFAAGDVRTARWTSRLLRRALVLLEWTVQNDSNGPRNKDSFHLPDDQEGPE